MKQSIHKKVCVITGGTGGIGYHLSLGFHEAGYQVIALDKEQHKPLTEEIEFIKTDVSIPEEVQSAFEQIAAKCGTVHVLINNAAISSFSKPISDISIEEFDAVIRVNLRGSFICAKKFIQANSGQAYGRIINIASTRWNQNEADWEAYGSSKGGIVSLTNTLAVSLSDRPITVNAISPGWIQTEEYEKLTDTDHAQHPSGRVGIPRDIVNACLFLADEQNDFINGHNLVIDGGMTKKMIYEE
ncbi:short-chain dehydrogenase [Bacillus sp. FJAT-27231]|uniref:SDR family NAD(P)-dependent oxidoreductase n=1 Tax=Bacillus sp. FJAT-27231 TaxID=1679168 RepID=UPI0006712B26|nr:SDR family oxidoreductase [Bacillus sp. FJAT-27231]KMY53774.1 short-chain dehydrogenase [Bacillus sp. FJAT-27231]